MALLRKEAKELIALHRDFREMASIRPSPKLWPLWQPSATLQEQCKFFDVQVKPCSNPGYGLSLWSGAEVRKKNDFIVPYWGSLLAIGQTALWDGIEWPEDSGYHPASIQGSLECPLHYANDYHGLAKKPNASVRIHEDASMNLVANSRVEPNTEIFFDYVVAGGSVGSPWIARQTTLAYIQYSHVTYTPLHADVFLT